MQEYDRILDAGDPGLSAFPLHLIPSEDVAASLYRRRCARPADGDPSREQGVNGQVEMAAAFDRAGFDPGGRPHERRHRRPGIGLADFKGFVAPGGFSYGDTLGGGEGWAKSVLFNASSCGRSSSSVLRHRDPTPSPWVSATAAR